jgi:hypothetical protein
MFHTSSLSFERQGLPWYPYTIIRIFLCGHPSEHIEVNIDPDGNKQHTLLSTRKLNISRWIDHGDKRTFDLKFSLQRCRKCAEEHKEKRKNTHAKDVRSKEASQGEAMRERGQRRDGFDEALQRRGYSNFYQEDYVPYHNELDENDYRKQDRTVKGPGGQSYERAVRGTEEELAILERIARFEEKKKQEERERQERDEFREQQERRELRKRREQEELREEREREQSYQQQLHEQQHRRACIPKEQCQGHISERADSRATLRNSRETWRTSDAVMRNSAGTVKSTRGEEGEEPKGWRNVLSRAFPRPTSEGSRRSSDGSKPRISTPVLGSFVHVGGDSIGGTSGYDDEERKGSARFGTDVRGGVHGSWENKEDQESRWLAARGFESAATKTSEGAAESSSKETKRGSPGGARERYEA